MFAPSRVALGVSCQTGWQLEGARYTKIAIIALLMIGLVALFACGVAGCRGKLPIVTSTARMMTALSVALMATTLGFFCCDVG